MHLVLDIICRSSDYKTNDFGPSSIESRRDSAILLVQ